MIEVSDSFEVTPLPLLAAADAMAKQVDSKHWIYELHEIAAFDISSVVGYTGRAAARGPKGRCPGCACSLSAGLMQLRREVKTT